jgi:hypothetical protein
MTSLVICVLFSMYSYDDPVREDEMGGARSMYRVDDKLV